MNSSQTTDFVSWLAKHLHAHARRAILVNAQSDRQFKTQSGYFGNCQISLNTEKIIILPIFFSAKAEDNTRLCCSLAIGVKIVQLISLFLVVMF